MLACLLLGCGGPLLEKQKGKTMTKLHVLYDAECALCRRCRAFLTSQPAYIPLDFVPLQSPDLEDRFPGIAALQPEKEIIVITDEGAVYQGGSAWIMCLYALREYRPWSFRLATPALLPFAKKIVSSVSHNRRFLSQFFAASPAEDAMLTRLKETPCPGSCERC
jgi:predicted DCC family thiol-disulfide oxidoreductase YuxK